MQSSNSDSNPSAQMILSYVISLNLIKDSNTTSSRVKHIEPCSKMHLFRNAKISAERHLKTNYLGSDVIQARVTSGLLIAADVTTLHSSRRTFGAPRSLSARHLRKGVSTRNWSIALFILRQESNVYRMQTFQRYLQTVCTRIFNSQTTLVVASLTILYSFCR